jgi:hypothetical protein
MSGFSDERDLGTHTVATLSAGTSYGSAFFESAPAFYRPDQCGRCADGLATDFHHAIVPFQVTIGTRYVGEFLVARSVKIFGELDILPVTDLYRRAAGLSGQDSTALKMLA